MMNKLLGRIRLLSIMEQNEAAKNYGSQFVDLHQGYGVLREEYSEAEDDMAYIENAIRLVLRQIREDPDEETLKVLRSVESLSQHSAAEMIQVSAMARKMQKTAQRMIKEKEQ